IEPSQSQVVQIKAAEIISSDKFRTGCTLRFPRLERVRDDKLWYDCMDLEQLATAQSMGEGRLTHQHLGLDDAYGGGPPQKKIKASVRLPRKRGVASQFQPADISTVTQVSKMFAGLEFCIVNGPSGHPKAKLEKSIAEHGGSFVQSPGQDTFCVVADKLTARVRNFISAKQHDVVKADWLLQCLEFGSRVKLLPSHMLHTSVMTAAKFAEDFDEYGDSFADNVDEKQLRTIFDHIDTDSVHEITSRELAKMEEKYFPGPSVYRIFRHLKFYLDRFSLVNDATTGIVNSSLDLVSLDIQNHAGTVCNSLDDDVSHVVFDSSDLSRLQAIVDINHERSVKFHCVTHRWVQECIEQGALRNEAQFTEGLVF
ncbi:DNA ligase 4-like, partial [Corticium candelabrum]|uniref:DNA ligase 4-like n=1 Tax=Corticium candelabrum TaxID=121492 RepID=UPI002E274101